MTSRAPGAILHLFGMRLKGSNIVYGVNNWISSQFIYPKGFYMRKEVVMSKDERSEMKALLEQKNAYAFTLATISQQMYEIEGKIWKVARKHWPGVVKIGHPDKGKWSVTVEDGE